VNAIGFDAFLPSATEMDEFKRCLTFILGRKISEGCEHFHWMDKVIPKHIPHDLQEEMSKPSTIFLLPIMLKNESCYSDCIAIMEEYVSSLNRWYAKAGRGKKV
jgi:hypothetical protein